MSDARTLAENASRPNGEARRRSDEALARTGNGLRRTETPRTRHDTGLAPRERACAHRGDSAQAFEESTLLFGALASPFGEPALFVRETSVLATGHRLARTKKRGLTAAARAPLEGPLPPRGGTARSVNITTAGPRGGRPVSERRCPVSQGESAGPRGLSR
jgi:hypothetical protein